MQDEATRNCVSCKQDVQELKIENRPFYFCHDPMCDRFGLLSTVYTYDQFADLTGEGRSLGGGE